MAWTATERLPNEERRYRGLGFRRSLVDAFAEKSKEAAANRLESIYPVFPYPNKQKAEPHSESFEKR